jgi:uncharacterized protein involved in exopolysaccharide biosynthesis
MQGASPSVGDVDVDLARLWQAITGRWKTIVVVAVLAALAGLAFAMFATPHYKAATRILIETRESVYTRPGNFAEADRPVLDEEGVTSQAELVSSSDILRTVVRELDMARAAYEQLNEQLSTELPQLIDLRVPYLDPSFEALVKIQLRFCAEAYSRMAQVQQYLDADTRDQYAEGHLDARVEQVLQEIRELSISGTV